MWRKPNIPVPGRARPLEPIFNHRRNGHDAVVTDAANGAVGRRDVLAR